MKLIYIFVILLIVTSVFNQLLDFCSNNVLLHEQETECLNIVGCCYAILELNNDFGLSSDENITVNSCFKMYKEAALDTCQDYSRLSNEYGNKVFSCNCYK